MQTNNKRWLNLCMGWGLYTAGLAAVLLAPWKDYGKAAAAAMVLQYLVTLALLYGVFQPRFNAGKATKLVAVALAGLMLLTCHEAMASPTKEHSEHAAKDKGEPAPQIIGPCFAVIVIAAIGAAGIYTILKFCKKAFPPTPPPPPVPVPPPVPTNAPPVATNPVVVARPAFLTANDGPPSPPPGGGNGSTNAPGPAPQYFWLPPWKLAASQTNTVPDGEGGALYDISSLGYTDTNGAAPAPITSFLTLSVPGIQSSTNGLDWTAYRLEGWVSGSGMISVLYDGQGAPALTNYGPASPGGLTNTTPFGIWVGREDRKFVRLQP